MYDSFKGILNSTLLNQLNISSLIILVGVAFEIQKTLMNSGNYKLKLVNKNGVTDSNYYSMSKVLMNNSLYLVIPLEKSFFKKLKKKGLT